MLAIRERLAALLHEEHGEGVISSAVAVLITAFLGAAMWVVFSNLMSSASDTACDQVATIGSSGTGAGGGCDTSTTTP